MIVLVTKKIDLLTPILSPSQEGLRYIHLYPRFFLFARDGYRRENKQECGKRCPKVKKDNPRADRYMAYR